MRKGLWFLVVCIVAFVCGIAVGFINSRSNKDEPLQATEEKIEAVSYEEETLPRKKMRETDYYFVCTMDESVVIFEVFDDNTKEELGRSDIDVDILPDSDKDMLSQGVAFEEKEEALMLIEDFVS